MAMDVDADLSTAHDSQPIHIELRLDGSSPTGRATTANGETRTFSGWLALVSAVDALVAEEASEQR
jgi:hypothetical protein